MKHHFAELSKIQRSLILNLGLLLMSFVFVLVYSQAGSPLYQIGSGDCDIFKIIGIGITQGKLPYVDLFDHKGPLLFYLFALASWIGTGKLGLFILQVIFLYFSFFFQYKISRQFLSVKGSIVTLIIAFVFLTTVIGEGAQSEFFELTFIYISLYYGVKFFRDEKSVSILKLGLIIGACFACVFLMRMNDAAQIGMLSLSVFVCLILKKSYSDLWKFPCYCLLAFFMVCLPFIVYFSIKGIMGDVWYGMFTFNVKYAAVSWTHNYMLKILVFSFVLLSLYLVYAGKKYTRFCNYVMTPLIIVELFTIGNNPFPHYYQVITPIIALLAALLYNRIYISLLLWVIGISGWNIGEFQKCKSEKPMWGSFMFATYDRFKLYKEGLGYYAIQDEMHKLLEKVPASERGEIWNIMMPSSEFDMFILYNVMPGNRFFIRTHKYFDPDILKVENIMDSYPKWIVATIEHLGEGEYQLLEDSYTEEYSYTHDGRTVALYKLNH